MVKMTGEVKLLLCVHSYIETEDAKEVKLRILTIFLLNVILIHFIIQRSVMV